jgi:hypothetical protein
VSGLRSVIGTIVMPMTAQGAGTYTSGPIANPGAAASVIAAIHISAVTGSTQTLITKLQSSPDGTTWTDIPGSTSATLTAIGNTMVNAIADDDYVQVSATVGGTGTPVVTFKVSCLVVTG